MKRVCDVSILISQIDYNEQFNILDCGAGQGEALNELCSSGFGKHVRKATGISLHAFSNVKQLLLKHKKMHWYIGDALDILPRLPSDYDLITDVWGVYSYSIQRMELLKLYHNVLRPGGKAYIFCSSDNILQEDKEDKEDREGKNVRLESYLAKKYPHTFFYENRIFVMTKVTERFPILDNEFSIQKCKYGSSISTVESKSEALNGNSWYPKTITFKRTPTKNMGLRRLPLKRRHKSKKNDTKNTSQHVTRLTRNVSVMKPVWDFAKSLWSLVY